MKNRTPRFVAIFLIYALLLPSPAFAMRTQSADSKTVESGLEEALRSGKPDALFKFGTARLAGALGISPAVPSSRAPAVVPPRSSTVAAGLEERAVVQERVRRFLAGLEEQAPQGMTPILIGRALQGQDARFRALAGLEQFSIYLDPGARDRDSLFLLNLS